ncbi:MAG: hypothetical protein V1703_04870 [Candidatus Altiarchaeota archaeon]
MDAVNASRSLNYSCPLSEDYKGELLLVNDSCVGKPLWIKIPYYPNWKTNDARRLYFATPNLMLAFPESEHFTLYYSWLPSDIAGYIVTIIALVIVIYAALLSSVVFRERIHEPLFKALEKVPVLNSIMRTLPKTETWAEEFADSAITTLNENKWRILLVIALLWVGSFAMNYNARASSCSSECSSKGYEGYTIPMFSNVIDNYDMGSNNEKENILRDLKCTAVCDPTRKDFVYASGNGYVDFTMYVKSMAQNILSIRAIDNQNCRQNDVYMDGQYIGQMYGIGEIGQRTNFDLHLPIINKSVVRIRIYQNSSKTDCYGFDVFSNQIKIPMCSCLATSSSEQTIDWVVVNLVGLLAFITAVLVSAYTLTAYNKTLKTKVHDRIKVRLGRNMLYRTQLTATSFVWAKAKSLMSVKKNRKYLILLLVAIIAAYFLLQYSSQYFKAQSICSMECQSQGFKVGHAPSKTIVDELKLGYDNRDGYQEHNFFCTAVCDEQRKNYVYVSGGTYIEFELNIEPNEENLLAITAGNFNNLCRQNDIYVNGQYVGEIYQKTDALPEGEYVIKLPKMNTNRIKVKISHSTSKTQCWGHDIFKVTTKLPKCVCE